MGIGWGGGSAERYFWGLPFSALLSLRVFLYGSISRVVWIWVWLWLRRF